MSARVAQEARQNRLAVWSALTAITYASGNPDRETARLRKALLALASQTPDNLAAIDRIKVIGADNGLSVVIGQAEIPIVDLAWTFESIPLPDGIAMDHPELDRED